MIEIFLALASAFWLGMLTSISPCPLATNIAAVSFLSKKIAHPFMVFISGAAYTIGRMAAYAMLDRGYITQGFISSNYFKGRKYGACYS